jgi:hypothetical protein
MLRRSLPGRLIQAVFPSSLEFEFVARADEIARQFFMRKTDRILSPCAPAGQQLPYATYASASASKNLTPIDKSGN